MQNARNVGMVIRQYGRPLQGRAVYIIPFPGLRPAFTRGYEQESPSGTIYD